MLFSGHLNTDNSIQTVHEQRRGKSTQNQVETQKLTESVSQTTRDTTTARGMQVTSRQCGHSREAKELLKNPEFFLLDFFTILGWHGDFKMTCYVYCSCEEKIL